VFNHNPFATISAQFFKVKWETWKRADGTNTTWDNSLIPDEVIQEWERVQKQRRLAKARSSLGVPIRTTYGFTDMLTINRYDAFDESLQELALRPPLVKELEQKMEELRNLRRRPNSSRRRSSPEVIDISDDLTQPDTQTPLRKSNRLRSTAGASSSKTTPNNLPSTSLRSPPKRRRVSPEIPLPGEPKDPINAQKKPLKRVQGDTNSQGSKKFNRAYAPRKIRLEGRCEEPVNDAIPLSPTFATHPFDRRANLAEQWTEIAKAAGGAYITITNEIDDEDIPKLAPGFQYIEAGYLYSHDVPKAEDLDDALFLRCNCRRCTDPQKCECQSISELVDKKGKKQIAYNSKGLFVIDVTPGLLVIECNKYCGCDLLCPNRVSQRPRKIPVDIFKTMNRGWGARPLCDVSKGAVLGMYAGKLMTRRKAEELGQGERGFCFDLDGQENPYDDAPGLPEAYTVDSRTCGNWTHFVNHSCSPNLQVYQAVHNTIPELNIPFIIFCATQDIPAKCELTLDYDPCAVNDEIPIVKKRKRGRKSTKNVAPDGAILCKCGEDECRRWIKGLG
jgi:histone-lysine N-methyltransferase SUV39H